MADNWQDSVAVSNSNNLFQDSQTETETETKTITTTTTITANTGGGTDANTSLNMMGLGLSSQPLPQSLDWNSFQNVDLYGSPSTVMQSLFGSDDHQQQEDSGFDQNQGICYSLYCSKYGGKNAPAGGGDDGELSTSNWSKFPPQPVNSPLKLQITSKVVKDITSESSTKRPRQENPLTLPAFKVKKEKMGDRITALQQLLSPFGKADTTSVLSQTTEYITFLHEQVSILSTPYMRNRSPILRQQQNIQMRMNDVQKD